MATEKQNLKIKYMLLNLKSKYDAYYRRVKYLPELHSELTGMLGVSQFDTPLPLAKQLFDNRINVLLENNTLVLTNEAVNIIIQAVSNFDLSSDLLNKLGIKENKND